MKNWTFGRLVFWLVAAVVLVTGAGLAIRGVLPPLLDRLGLDVQRAFTRPFFHLGGLGIAPVFLLKSICFLLILVLVARAAREFVRTRVVARTSLDLGQQDAAARITGYLVFLLGLAIGLQSAGVNLSSLVVVGGAVSIGVGFGLQTIANNFVSGLILLVERPIKLGDRVEVGEINGDVVRIAARSTWVRTNDNVVIIVPNSEFVSNRITNWTANDRQVRFSVPVGVSYGSNPEEVRDVLIKVAQDHPDVLDQPAPEVRFVAFGDSSLDFELRVWTIKRVQTPKTLTSELLFSIFRAFGEHGIEIPFPQRDVHLRSVAASIPISNVP
ncbi:MAG TPA: mechanosensitive ion channel domain-containing protein [Terriglobia bacterium]|nr:mechanosensitive ion channel domain-containing protein [Terriglobia bacterium]